MREGETCRSQECHAHAAIGLFRREVDGSHCAAGGAMPGQAEVSGAVFDRADDRTIGVSLSLIELIQSVESAAPHPGVAHSFLTTFPKS